MNFSVVAHVTRVYVNLQRSSLRVNVAVTTVKHLAQLMYDAVRSLPSSMQY
jgi:hypothetical protein